jgi:hypothetical protein
MSATKKALVLGLSLAASVLLLIFAGALKHRFERATKEHVSIATGADAEPPPVAPRRWAPSRPRLAPASLELPDNSPLPASAKSVGTSLMVSKSDKEYQEELNRAFNADRPADANSSKTASAIVNAFGDVRAQGAHLAEVECHASRCRLGVDFSDKAADHRVMEDLYTLLSEAGLDVTTLDLAVSARDRRPDGTISATIHLFRSAASL